MNPGMGDEQEEEEVDEEQEGLGGGTGIEKELEGGEGGVREGGDGWKEEEKRWKMKVERGVRGLGER